MQGQIETAETVAGEGVRTALEDYSTGTEVLHDLANHLRDTQNSTNRREQGTLFKHRHRQRHQRAVQKFAI